MGRGSKGSGLGVQENVQHAPDTSYASAELAEVESRVTKNPSGQTNPNSAQAEGHNRHGMEWGTAIMDEVPRAKDQGGIMNYELRMKKRFKREAHPVKS